MTKDEALKLALEALQFDSFYGTGKQEAITAIEAELEAKDEPLTENGMYRLGYHNGYGFGEAYGKANAPQRTWDELTLAEVKEAYAQHAKHQTEDMGASGWVEFADALQTILRSKNT